MFRPLSLYIGSKYTRAKRRNSFISFIALSSMLGVALGVAALITVLSVMNGFENELKERILGMTAHGFITQRDGKLQNWQKLQNKVKHDPDVIASAPFIEGQAMLSQDGRVQGTMVRGINSQLENTVSDVNTKMIHGSLAALQPGKFGVVLGKDLAATLGVSVGDKVTMITPDVNATPAGVIPRLKRLTVVGIFQIGMYEYDSGLAVMNIKDAAKLFKMPGKVSGLRLKFDDLFQAPKILRKVMHNLPSEYIGLDWTYQHANFFRALKTEKTAMFVILMLIVAVAAFNIISTLIMVVTDKQSDIAILKTLGMRSSQIMGIFMVQGTIIGLVGTIFGVVGGVLLAWNVPNLVKWLEQVTGYHFLPADVYYISELPSKLEWHDVTVIGLTAFILSIISTIYPAWRGAKVKPAEALRYE